MESASSSVRKHIERALGYGNLMNRIGEKIFLLAPSFCPRVWSLPEPARERFGEALKELKTPPSRAELRTMCQAAVQEPESPAPVESTPEDELETLIVKARKLIKSAGLELLLLVLPAPLPADPYKVRTIDQRSCVNCTVRGVDATFRLLARAVESFRRSGTHLSSKLRTLIQSTLPEGP